MGSGRIRLVRPLNRANVKLFEQLYKLYVTDEMIEAFLKRENHRLTGAQSDSDDAENDFDMDKNENGDLLMMR